jgi:glutaredoxin 3
MSPATPSFSLAPPTGVAMFSTEQCPYCIRAEQFLRSKGVELIVKFMVDQDAIQRARMTALTNGRRTVPQIFIAGTHVGGCDDLMALSASDPERLDSLLAMAAKAS